MRRSAPCSKVRYASAFRISTRKRGRYRNCRRVGAGGVTLYFPKGLLPEQPARRAVPGIGYHIDKPLLYYSAKCTRAAATKHSRCSIRSADRFERSAEKIEQAVQTALSAAGTAYRHRLDRFTTVFSSSRRASALRLCRTVCCSAQHSSAAGMLRRLNRPCPISIRPASPFTAPPIRERTPR